MEPQTIDHLCLHETDFAIMKRDIAEIKKAVCGSGKEPLEIRIDRLEQKAIGNPSPRLVMLYATVGGGVTFVITKLITLAVGV